MPGELLRFPNLGLPLPPSSSEESDDKTNTSEGSKGKARGGKTKAKSTAEHHKWAVERAKRVLKSMSSSATGRAGAGGDGAGRTAFGDLVVQASVTLPGGEIIARFERHGHYYRGGPK